MATTCSFDSCPKTALEKWACDRCHVAPYCSNKCRKADRKAHKAACRAIVQGQTAAMKAVEAANIRAVPSDPKSGFSVKKIVVTGEVQGNTIYSAEHGQLDISSATFETTASKLTFLKALEVSLAGQILISGDDPACGFFISTQRLVIRSPTTITCPGSLTLDISELVLRAKLTINCKLGEDEKPDITARKVMQITSEASPMENIEVVQIISAASMAVQRQQASKGDIPEEVRRVADAVLAGKMPFEPTYMKKQFPV